MSQEQVNVNTNWESRRDVTKVNGRDLHPSGREGRKFRFKI